MTRYLLAAILMASGMKLIIGAEAIGGLCAYFGRTGQSFH